eukprot:5701187-Pyramimonas_sp.AAC.1
MIVKISVYSGLRAPRTSQIRSSCEYPPTPCVMESSALKFCSMVSRRGAGSLEKSKTVFTISRFSRARETRDEEGLYFCASANNALRPSDSS